MMQSCASAAKLRGGGPFSKPVCQHHGLLRVTPPRIVIGYRQVLFSSGSESLFCLTAYLTPLATQRQSEPRQWSLGAIGQLAICAPALRSLFCVFRQRSRFVPDTTGSMRCLSGGAKNAKLTRSCRGVLGRCPPSRVLSLAVCCRSRLALQ